MALAADDEHRRGRRLRALYPAAGAGLDVVFDGIWLRYSPFSGDLGVLNRDAGQQKKKTKTAGQHGGKQTTGTVLQSSQDLTGAAAPLLGAADPPIDEPLQDDD